ncbi:hypothetical protein AALD22_15845 [Lachnospiraceae bacterium 56-18]|jgi:hypothetical protein
MKVTNIRKPKTRDYEPKQEAVHIYRSLLIKLQADKRIGEKRQK